MFGKTITLLRQQINKLSEARKEAADKFRSYDEPQKSQQMQAIHYYTDFIFEIESAIEVLKQVGSDICEENEGG